jgi:hypothetical protein
MESSALLSKLPTEILFQIFKLLGRADKIRFGLTSPQILHLFAVYFDLDRFRSDALFKRKLGVPNERSFQDPKAQAAIIRYLAMSGYADIISPRPKDNTGKDAKDDAYGVSEVAIRHFERAPLDIENAGDDEDAVVERVLGEWLQQRCGVEGGIALCIECYKFIPLRDKNGGQNLWAKKMLGEPSYVLPLVR